MELDLHTLAIVGVIVDYYAVHEIIQARSTAWVNHLRVDLLGSVSADVPPLASRLPYLF
jgi:hypothetical protein